MQIIELYVGEDNKTHTRDYTPEEFAEIAYKAKGPILVPAPHSGPNRPGEFYVDWHPFKLTVMYVMCTGTSEYGSEEGWRRLKPGDIVIFNDPHGKGHQFHISGTESRIHFAARWNPDA
jgi:hypothetical protein